MTSSIIPSLLILNIWRRVEGWQPWKATWYCVIRAQKSNEFTIQIYRFTACTQVKYGVVQALPKIFDLPL